MGVPVQFHLITDHEQGLDAFSSVKRSFARGAQQFPQHSVGWRSNSGRFNVYWRPDLKVWGVFEPKPPKSQGRRFWICFGVDDPAKKSMLSITLETNPPHEGVNRQVGGAFLRDGQGGVYLAHSDKVGGGRRGIGASAFLSFYTQGQRSFVPERNAELIILGRVDAPDLAKRVAAYTKEVARFKQHVAATHQGR
jgi:hypothetical protein